MDQEQLDFLTQQKIELLLQMKTKQFSEDIASLKQSVNALEHHVASLRSELAKRPMPTRQEPVITPLETRPEPVRPAPTTQPAATPTASSSQTGQTAQKSQSSNGSHPRQGNYNSDDVSIEKYFNFSRK